MAREIEGGAFSLGAAFPTRHALARRFGVARATVDQAVRTLVARGLVQSRRGAGSVVINTSRILQVAFVSDGHSLSSPEASQGVAFTYLTPEVLTARAARERLLDFDGLIWSMPGPEQLAWAGALQGRIPQVVVNRTPPALDYVSTDHTGAVYQLAVERLRAHPEWLPVFLGGSADSPAGAERLRFEGFLQACRECKLFYERLAMPTDFEERWQRLRTRFQARSQPPLMMVSASRGHTGAVMAWVRESGRQWRQDVLYSDFDNDYDRNVWGVKVTSFLQDYPTMHALAIRGLVDLIQGRAARVQILQPPLRCDGDT